MTRMFVCSFSSSHINTEDGLGEDTCMMRGDSLAFTVWRVLYPIQILIFLIGLAMLVLVVAAVYDQEKLFAVYKKNCRIDSIIESKTSDLHLAKVIMKQALAYVVAIVLVNIFPFISLGDGTFRMTPALQISHLIIRPLKGFFNLLIFLYHKVYNLRRNDPDLSILGAIVVIFDTSGDLPEHAIMSLHLVRNYEGDNEVVELVDFNEAFEPPVFASRDTVYGEDNVDKGRGSSASGDVAPETTSNETKVTPSSSKPIEGDSLNKKDDQMHGKGSSSLDLSGFDSFDDNADRLNKEDESVVQPSLGQLKSDRSSSTRSKMHSSTVDQSGDSFEDDNADLSYDPSRGGAASRDSKFSLFSKALSSFSGQSLKHDSSKGQTSHRYYSRK